MSRLRTLRGFGGAVMFAAALAAGFAGCSSGGIGKDECRSIEYARCNAAAYCNVGLDSDTKVKQCEHFSRDNCLHGLRVAPPRSSDVDHCVTAINTAGACARRDGRRSLANDCTALEGAVADKEKTTVCDVITDPDLSSECAFLTDTPVEVKPPEDAGAG